METLVLGIGGMKSGACAGNIEKQLYGVRGVQSAVVSFDLESAEIVYDPAQAEAAQFAQAVVDAGYVARMPGGATAEVTAPVGRGNTNSGCG